MSRTFRTRAIHYFDRIPRQRTLQGLGWDWSYDDREGYWMGYDGKPSSYLHSDYPGKGYKDAYAGRKTRKFFKRKYSKARRRDLEYDLEY